MSNNGLRESLKRVASTLKAAEIDFALGGGYAAWARGAPEPEHDVDFVILPKHLDRAEQALREVGFEVQRPSEDWLVKIYDQGRLIDLLFETVDQPVESLLARAEVIRVEALTMPVLSATDIMVTKLLSLSEGHCDLTPIVPVARALREQVDWRSVHAATRHSPYATAFLHLGVRLGIIPQLEQEKVVDV